MISRLAALLMRRPVHHTLIFHRVLDEQDPMNPDEPTAAWFRRLVAMLSTHYEPISLNEALRRANADELKGNTLSITFDDGYADNYTMALPILQEFNVPATFFVASDYVDGGRMWNDSIIEVFRQLDDGRHAVDLDDTDHVAIHDWQSRRQAAEKTISAWKHLPPDERQARVDALSTRTGSLPSDLMMTTAQLRDMAASKGVTIGGHTRTHPILTKIDNNEARGEIAGGKRDLEACIQKAITLFAYPNGKFGRDFDETHAAIAREEGFQAAVATDWGVTSASSDRFKLPRFTPWHNNLSRFSIDLARCHYGLI